LHALPVYQTLESSHRRNAGFFPATEGVPMKKKGKKDGKGGKKGK